MISLIKSTGMKFNKFKTLISFSLTGTFLIQSFIEEKTMIEEVGMWISALTNHLTFLIWSLSLIWFIRWERNINFCQRIFINICSHRNTWPFLTLQQSRVLVGGSIPLLQHNYYYGNTLPPLWGPTLSFSYPRSFI